MQDTAAQSQLSEAFQSIVDARRSVRVYDALAPFDPAAVERSLERAILSPNSSNMQLWEFYRVRTPEKKAKLAEYCMGQKAASTANELVVFVVRPDLWRKHQQWNAAQLRASLADKQDKPFSKDVFAYYEKLMPIVYGYNDPLGIVPFFKKAFAWFVGLRRPMVREVGAQDIRVVVHKTAALAAMTFMYSMKAEGYDTCPMEGFDSARAKKLLGLPSKAEICMIVACGPAAEGGVYGPRYRLPKEEVVFEV